MSPEYNFYIKANLKNEAEAEELAGRLRELPGVEIVAATTPMELVGEMSMGELVRSFRLQSGLSMHGLSVLSDLSADTISHIEKGQHKNRMTNTTAAKLIWGFGFEPEDPRTELFYAKLEQANKLQKP